MLTTSAGYKTAITASEIRTRILGTITLPDTTVINITDADLLQNSLYMTEQCASGENIEIGGVYAAELGLSLITPLVNPYALTGAVVDLDFGVLTGISTWEDVPLGIFNSAIPERKIDSVKLTAYDNVIKLDCALGATLTTGTPYQLINSACGTAGITLATSSGTIAALPNGTATLTIPTNSNIATCRDLVMWVCQALSVFGRCNRTGEFEVVQLHGASVRTITADDRYSPSTVSDNVMQVTQLQMIVGETTYISGAAGMQLTLDSNPLFAGLTGTTIQTALDAMLAEITQAEYTPCDINYIGDPSLQAGDYITLDETGSLSATDPVCLITSQTWKYRGKHAIKSAAQAANVSLIYSQINKAISSAMANAKSAAGLAVAVQTAAGLINNAIGGNVLIRENGSNNEILIMDNPDPTLAVKLWRWNIGGLGYSSNCTGADNPARTYTVAMTMDGGIVATFINTGTLTIGTSGGERLEISPTSGAYMTGYDADNDIRVRYKSTGIDWYDSTGTVYVTDSVTTVNKIITVGSGKDYATIQAAIDSLPKNINHTIYIDIYSGTYSEDVTIENYQGSGDVWVQEHTGETVYVSSFTIKNCSCQIRILKIDITSTTATAIYIERSNKITISQVSSTSTCAYSGVYADYFSNVRILNSTFSNKGYGINAQNISFVSLNTVAGTGNTVGIYASNSIVMDDACTITGTTPRSASVGVIIPRQGMTYKPQLYTPTLTNSWVNFASGYSTCQYYKDGFGIVHLKGMIKSGTIGATAFTLPTGYRPTEHMYFGTSSAGAFGSLAVYSDGPVVPDKGSNIWFSLDGVTFAAA